MSLCTPAEERSLRSWNILRDYLSLKDELIAFARTVYLVAKQFINPNPPLPQECEGGIIAALLSSPGFIKLLKSKRIIKEEDWSYFARAMAHYLLDKHWDEIIK